MKHLKRKVSHGKWVSCLWLHPPENKLVELEIRVVIEFSLKQPSLTYTRTNLEEKNIGLLLFVSFKLKILLLIFQVKMHILNLIICFSSEKNINIKTVISKD